MRPLSRRQILSIGAAGLTTALAGCSGTASEGAGRQYIESITTEQRANPRVVDLVVELVADHGATRVAVVDGTGNTVFQQPIRTDQRFVRIPLEDGVDAILHPIATVETLDHEIVLYDGEEVLTRNAWRPTIELDYAFELRNDSDVTTANSIRMTLRNESDIRMRPLRSYIAAGFPTEVHRTTEVGKIAPMPTTPTWAVSGESTYNIVADHPSLGTNLLAPPDGECFTESKRIELVVEYEQPLIDRIALTVSLAGDPRPYEGPDGAQSVFCSRPSIETWELIDRELLA